MTTKITKLAYEILSHYANGLTCSQIGLKYNSETTNVQKYISKWIRELTPLEGDFSPEFVVVASASNGFKPKEVPLSTGDEYFKKWFFENKNTLTIVDNKNHCICTIGFISLSRLNLPKHLAQFDLTKKQSIVAQFLCDGLTDDEIAVKMGITTRTVQSHTQSIFKKANVHSRHKLAVVALTNKTEN